MWQTQDNIGEKRGKNIAIICLPDPRTYHYILEKMTDILSQAVDISGILAAVSKETMTSEIDKN